MISCDHDILSLYLDGALTLPQRVHLESHLRVCEACARELEVMRRIDLVVESWGAIRTPVPAATNQRVLRSVERKRRLGPLGDIGRMVPAAFGTGIAALLVLVSVNAGIIAQTATPPPTTNVPTGASRVLIKQSDHLPLINSGHVSANREVADARRDLTPLIY